MDRRTFLRAAAVALPSIAGCSSGSTTSSDPTVSVSGMGYRPRKLSIEVGETVTWVNENQTILPKHTVTAKQIHEDAVEWQFDKTLEKKGDEVSYTFEEPGIYTYVGTVKGEKCMCGAVLVGDVSLNDPLPCSPVRGGGC